MRYILIIFLLLFSYPVLAGCVSGDCINSYGTFFYLNGDSYDGKMKNGLKDGHGIYTYSNGNIFIGEFVDDEANGQGAYIYKNR